MAEIKVTSEGPDTERFINRAGSCLDIIYNKKFIDEFRTVSERPLGTIGIDVSASRGPGRNICDTRPDGGENACGDALMDFSLFLRIADGITEFHPRASIALNTTGELFRHPRAMDMIRELKKRGLKLSLSTDGALLGHDEISELIELKVDEITFEIDALSRETYIAVRGEDKMNAAVGNLLFLLSKICGAFLFEQPRVDISFVFLNLNVREYAPFVSYWSDRVNRVRISKWVTDVKSPISIDALNQEFPKPARYLCIAPWRDMRIGPEGRVHPCLRPRGAPVMGDLRDRAPRDIWLGDEFMRLREAHVEGRFDSRPQCAACDAWNLTFIETQATFLGALVKSHEYYDRFIYEFITKFPVKPFDMDEYLKEAAAAFRT